MFYIAHRINTAEQLKQVPHDCGVEADLRGSGKRLILAHDASSDGEDLAGYLEHFRHRFLIANLKCEGIEQKVLEMLGEKKINDFFMLDLSFPAMVKLFGAGEKRIAMRVSEYEPVEAALALKDKVDWVWADCFHDFPLDLENYKRLKEHFKLCLVSPELQGHSPQRIGEFAAKIKQMPFDAVCTKHCQLWRQKLGDQDAQI